MSARRVVAAAPLVLLALGACISTPGTRHPRPLKPDDGPKASIRVGYSGGLVNRTLSAYFRTDRNAYVLVGHLGGDGIIRVLYPEAPGADGYVPGRETLQTETITAYYDGIPSLFSYTMSPFRSLAALDDSYDGRGHGYVFIIASHSPMNHGLLDDLGDWAEWAVDDYTTSYDPRYAVRMFADAVAGRGYTLEFAGSFTASNYTAYASRSMDCALLATYGFGYSPWWNGWMNSFSSMLSGFGFGGSPYGFGLSSYCGHPAGRYAVLHRNSAPPIVTTILPVVNTPTQPAPTLNRPGRRGLPGPTSETSTRISLTRLFPTTRTQPLGEPAGTGTRTNAYRPTYGEDRRAGIDRPNYGETHRSRPTYDDPRVDRPTSRTGNDRPVERDRGTATTTSAPTRTETRTETTTPKSDDRGVSNPREVRRPDTP